MTEIKLRKGEPVEKALRRLLSVARGGLRVLFAAQGQALAGELPADWWKPLYGSIKGTGRRKRP